MCVCVCVCVCGFYLPEVCHGGGQGALGGDVGGVPGIMIHLMGEEEGNRADVGSFFFFFKYYCFVCVNN